MSAAGRLKAILILSDGIRGHVNQSRGIAYWLSQLTGAAVEECEIPTLPAAARLRARSSVRAVLESGTRRDARDWLSASDGENLIREVGSKLAAHSIHENENNLLIISAGSSAAPYNIALAYLWSCACATVMTPSGLGTAPFDFAVVPEHDYPDRKANILTTMGSPNFVVKENLEAEAQKLLEQFPPHGKEKWSLLIGGDDANYRVSAEWAKRQIGRILTLAKHADADVYITTSRRTNKDAERAVKLMASHSGCVRYLCIASEDKFNPIPAMLGFSDEIFCTEDSVNMVSEAITGGKRAILLRVEHKHGVKAFLQKATGALAHIGALPQSALWGIPRFDAVFEQLARGDNLVEFNIWQKRRKEDNYQKEPANMCEFNEAKRAAQWICDSWKW